LKNWIAFTSDGAGVMKEVFKTETDDARGEDEVSRWTRRFGLSEFESLIDFCTKNDSSNLIKTLSIKYFSLNSTW